MPTSANDSQAATVLKGVVRVEALPTPSEHIPALMERVKPLYLSRTYEVPLPNDDDPSQGWEPEAFLDKLARMKGRLLRHGEPDLDSVAKILLSDWVRGRIPYFVPPPERPEELNATEAKKDKTKSNQADPEAPKVKQTLGSIMQRNTFLAEDIRPLDDEFLEGDADDLDEANESEHSDEEEEEEEELKWSDVFQGIDQDDVQADASYQDRESSSSPGNQILNFLSNCDYPSISGDGVDEQQQTAKEPRMTTNKVSLRILVSSSVT